MVMPSGRGRPHENVQYGHSTTSDDAGTDVNEITSPPNLANTRGGIDIGNCFSTDDEFEGLETPSPLSVGAAAQSAEGAVGTLATETSPALGNGSSEDDKRVDDGEDANTHCAQGEYDIAKHTEVVGTIEYRISDDDCQSNDGNEEGKTACLAGAPFSASEMQTTCEDCVVDPVEDCRVLNTPEVPQGASMPGSTDVVDTPPNVLVSDLLQGEQAGGSDELPECPQGGAPLADTDTAETDRNAEDIYSPETVGAPETKEVVEEAEVPEIPQDASPTGTVGTPEVPGEAKTTGVPDTSEKNEVCGTSALPGVSNSAAILESNGTVMASNFLENTKVIEVVGPAGSLEATGVVETHEDDVIPGAQDATVLAEGVEVPRTTECLEVAEAPEVVEAPQTYDAVGVMEVNKVDEELKVAVAPEAGDSPNAFEAVTMADVAGPPKGQVTGDAPEAHNVGELTEGVNPVEVSREGDFTEADPVLAATEDGMAPKPFGPLELTEIQQCNDTPENVEVPEAQKTTEIRDTTDTPDVDRASGNLGAAALTAAANVSGAASVPAIADNRTLVEPTALTEVTEIHQEQAKVEPTETVEAPTVAATLSTAETTEGTRVSERVVTSDSPQEGLLSAKAEVTEVTEPTKAVNILTAAEIPCIVDDNLVVEVAKCPVVVELSGVVETSETVAVGETSGTSNSLKIDCVKEATAVSGATGVEGSGVNKTDTPIVVATDDATENGAAVEVPEQEDANAHVCDAKTGVLTGVSQGTVASDSRGDQVVEPAPSHGVAGDGEVLEPVEVSVTVEHVTEYELTHSSEVVEACEYVEYSDEAVERTEDVALGEHKDGCVEVAAIRGNSDVVAVCAPAGSFSKGNLVQDGDLIDGDVGESAGGHSGVVGGVKCSTDFGVIANVDIVGDRIAESNETREVLQHCGAIEVVQGKEVVMSHLGLKIEGGQMAGEREGPISYQADSQEAATNKGGAAVDTHDSPATEGCAEIVVFPVVGHSDQETDTLSPTEAVYGTNSSRVIRTEGMTPAETGDTTDRGASPRDGDKPTASSSVPVAMGGLGVHLRPECEKPEMGAGVLAALPTDGGVRPQPPDSGCLKEEGWSPGSVSTCAKGMVEGASSSGPEARSEESEPQPMVQRERRPETAKPRAVVSLLPQPSSDVVAEHHKPWTRGSSCGQSRVPRILQHIRNPLNFTPAEEYSYFRARNRVSQNYTGPVHVVEEIHVGCAHCGSPVDAVSRIQAGNLHFHPQCVKCRLCGRNSITDAYFQVTNTSVVCSECSVKGFMEHVAREEAMDRLTFSSSFRHKFERAIGHCDTRNGSHHRRDVDVEALIPPSLTVNMSHEHGSSGNSRRLALVQRQQYYSQNDNNIICVSPPQSPVRSPDRL